MERTIVGFGEDETGDWVADLSCLHRQHVRHDPPFRVAPWVIHAEGRAAHVDGPIDCPCCDRAELPSDLEIARTTEVFDEETMPAGLARSHRVAAGVWGRLLVEHGRLHFQAETQPRLDVMVTPGAPQPIPPGVVHEVHPSGPVRFRVQFLRRPRVPHDGPA